MEKETMTYRVLIVDDSKLARMSIAKFLDALRPSWVRSESANAVEAMAFQPFESIDIALLDFNMPGQDGLSLAGEMHAIRPALPMAIISANAQDEILARAKAIGAEFLPKPLTQQALAVFLDAIEPRLADARPPE
jgi:CheY-like chemotaxis protein